MSPDPVTSPIADAVRFRTGDKVADLNPSATPGFDGAKADAAPVQAARSNRLAELQEMLYASSKGRDDARSVLLVLQGMDAAGKGGIVKHVVGAVNPMGVRYTAFGKPTPEELAHDFLWRIRRALPPPGHIGVFDRSHYEDVLIVRVHNLVPPEVWGARYDEINAFERELVDGGTTLVKVAMFISLDEQKKQLLERLDDPTKYWKYNPGDIDERLKWPQYQEAYQAVLDRTSTDYAPWHVVPCDRRWYSRLAVTELLIEALEALDLSYPPADFDVDAERKRLLES
ncbi:polyphosphate:nucleotide phosphotransferase [Mycolicibacterium flavescens]|uniref:polyphosphate kinase 2 family protein n=1 Tax=Mycobacterium TaxID=1763 RepID=UPI0007FC944A|nr:MULTISPECIES: polyphosphate kinase 2 family protein [Mycobacterium]OBF95611.1 polyphosphate kinase [Mycobacterium sp. 852002-51152_SCH6134967]VEG45862.1 polyphosphate:nucleotide phosphotransferase [Mycolicibacterium flavescens]